MTTTITTRASIIYNSGCPAVLIQNSDLLSLALHFANSTQLPSKKYRLMLLRPCFFYCAYASSTGTTRTQTMSLSIPTLTRKYVVHVESVVHVTRVGV